MRRHILVASRTPRSSRKFDFVTPATAYSMLHKMHWSGLIWSPIRCIATTLQKMVDLQVSLLIMRCCVHMSVRTLEKCMDADTPDSIDRHGSCRMGKGCRTWCPFLPACHSRPLAPTARLLPRLPSLRSSSADCTVPTVRYATQRIATCSCTGPRAYLPHSPHPLRLSYVNLRPLLLLTL